MALLMVRNPNDPAGGFYEFNALSGKQGSSIYFGKIDETNNIYTEITMPENWIARVNDLILAENGSIWQITNTNTNSVSWVADALKGEQGIPGEKGDQGEQGIQGEKGEQGEKGDKGDTYTLTEADKTEIANIALNLMKQAEDMSV